MVFLAMRINRPQAVIMVCSGTPAADHAAEVMSVKPALH